METVVKATKQNYLDLLYRALNRDIQIGWKERFERLGRRPKAYNGLERVHAIDPIWEMTCDMYQNPQQEGVTFDAAFFWGSGGGPANLMALEVAFRDNAVLFLCEDAFIRSADTWVARVPTEYKMSCGTLFDTLGHYFDATRESGCERMLNDRSIVVTDEQKEVARKLMGKIVKNKISKYNHQPIFYPANVGRSGYHKVLVIDQSYGDFSISKGLADANTFKRMLDDAVRDNPHCDVLVKTHPDEIARGHQSGYFSGNITTGDEATDTKVFKVTMPINPYSLMSIVDKVYVVSSQFGIEALMAGKQVYTYGMPFYAGWGLTKDAQTCERRTNTRTLEELFYLFYCVYSKWINPDMQEGSSIGEVIKFMIKKRKQYWDRYAVKGDEDDGDC